MSSTLPPLPPKSQLERHQSSTIPTLPSQPSPSINQKSPTPSQRDKAAPRCTKKHIRVIAFTTAAVLLLCALAFIGFRLFAPTALATKEKRQPSLVISLTIDTSYNDSSTPAIACLQKVSTKKVVCYPLKSGKNSLTVSHGKYAITYISPINPDGSIYRVPGKATVNATNQMDDVNIRLSAQFTRTAVEGTTDQQFAAAENNLKQAIANGDSSLRGTASKKILDKASKAATARSQAAEARQKAEEAQKAAAAERARQAQQAQQEAEHQAAINRAKSQGLEVFTGTVRVYKTDYDVDRALGVNNETDAGMGPITVLQLPRQTHINGMDHEELGSEDGNAVMIELGYDASGPWQRYNGQTITIAVSPSDIVFPGDPRAPYNQPGIYEAGAITVLF